MRSWELKGWETYKQRKRAPISFFVLMKPSKKMLIALDNFFFKPVGCQLATFLQS